MCGILGIASQHKIVEKLLQGLCKLEYRGYDSSGIAVLEEKIKCYKVKGKVDVLYNLVDQDDIRGSIGIGHTRWATHGTPSFKNAHPHCTKEVAVVHNGIIENASELKLLLKNDYKIECKSDTDTEVIVLFITLNLNNGLSVLDSVLSVSRILKGSFTFAALFRDDNSILAFKKGSPLLFGCNNERDIIVCSDAQALSFFSDRITYLEDYDCVYIKDDKFHVYDKEHKLITRLASNVVKQDLVFDKGNYPSYMLKEVLEQPASILTTFENFQVDNFPKLGKEITIVACGSSYFAALVARYWFESLANIKVYLEIASEFTYYSRRSGEITLFISQSGETADILAAIQHAKQQNNYTISLTNNKNSTVSRISDEVIYTSAGSEIGVASTKTFASQLVALQYLLVRQAVHIDSEQYYRGIKVISGIMTNFLSNYQDIHNAVRVLIKAKSVIYVGRGPSYGLAMEGALKMKELSYISAEGIAAGELKHGSMALIDDRVVTIVIIPYDELFYKTLSNIQEIVARGGKVIALTDEFGKKSLSEVCNLIIEMPTVDSFFFPLLYALPLQLIAYYTAIRIGNNVDQPRNLAKSVTVE